MNNTSISFEIDEITRLDTQVSEAYHGINTNLKNIKQCFDDLSTNVTGTKVNGLLVAISDKVSGINSKLDTSFAELDEFLSKQMSNYASTYDVALAMLNKALSFIDSNFQ